jgi:hypothetical protein
LKTKKADNDVEAVCNNLAVNLNNELELKNTKNSPKTSKRVIIQRQNIR